MNEELADLKRRLAARRNRTGYTENVRQIEARIAELEAQNGDI